MIRYYNAANEHKPFEKSESKGKAKGHPNKGLKGKNPYSGKTAS